MKKEPHPKEIARIARLNRGDKSWRTDRKRTTKDGKITSHAEAYKCNLFVYEMLKKAMGSAPTSGNKGKQPAQAGDWAKADAPIPGWEVVKDGTSQEGDVLSQANVGPGHTGHVSIVTKAGEETTGTAGDGEITTTNWGFRGILGGYVWGGGKDDVTVRRKKC